MQQLQHGQRSEADGKELGRSFELQGYPSYGGDLGISFVEHNSSPELWVDDRRRSHLWVWIVVALAVLLAALLIFRLTRTGGDPAAAGGAGGAAPAGGAAGTGGKAGGGRGQSGPASITTGESHSGSINIYEDALGTVTPVNTVTLYSQITGRVVAVHYREGQMVARGQPLVDIDPRPSQATLDQAKGTLERDQAVLAQAKIDVERYRAAYARNAIAKQQLDDQEQAVLQNEGTVQTDRASVAFDEVQLSYCHIVAPISGRVGLRLVDPGNTVFSGSSSTLAVITQLQPITVVFNVSEDAIPEIQAQGTRKLEVDAYDRSDAKLLEKGMLTSTDNQIDTTTGTIKFRAAFSNRTNDLFPNQFVNARLLVRTLTDAVLVPDAAIQHNGTVPFVYIVNAPGPARDGKPGMNTVSVQNVKVVTSNDTETAVEGLNAGVQLATSGFDRLESKAAVTVKGTRDTSGPHGKTDRDASPAATNAK